MAEDKKSQYELLCPICNNDMIIGESDKGGLYWRCPNCDFSRDFKQQYPVDGVIKQVEYVNGLFVNASLDKASKDNERNYVLIKAQNGDSICITQIAGLVARRIVCNVRKDEMCSVGERYGMIKFGSRIELYIPKHYKVEVLKGQRLVCGETVVASFEK